MRSSTSSIRLPNELSERLARTAKHLKRGKNWIINQALDEYLRKFDRDAFAAEARRQSLLVSAAENREEDEFWEKITDRRGWR